MTGLGVRAPNGGPRGPRLAPPAPAPHRHRRRRRRGAGRDQLLHRQPAGLGPAAGPGAARRRPVAGEPASLFPSGGSAARYSVSRSAPVAHHQLRRHGVRSPDRRHSSGSGGGDRGTVPVLRRDPNRARGGLEPASERAATWWWIPRSSRRSAPRSGIRSRWAKAASSSLARWRARPATRVSALPSDPGSTSRPAISTRLGLLGFGARAEYEAFLELPASVSAQTLADRYRTWSPRRAGPASHRR